MNRHAGMRLFCMFLAGAAGVVSASPDDPLPRSFLSKQLLFEPNAGQAAPDVQFVARTARYTLLLKETEATLQFRKERLTIGFVGVDRAVDVSGLDAWEAKVNYFSGPDARLWKRGIGTYGKVKYTSLYPDIDMVFHSKEGLLEYDFNVRPGAELNRIALRFGGTLKPSVDGSGELRIAVAGGEIRLHAPVVYQGSNWKGLRAKYTMRRDGTVGFSVSGYDHSKTLVIDPVVSYSSYVGGSDDEGIFGIQRDKEGNVYVSGETSSLNFPMSDPVQRSEGGDYDAFVSKFDATGTHLIYSTYLGGTAYDHAVGLAVDSRGEAYIAGLTSSPNFPVKNALQSTLKGKQNAFVAHLTRSGSELVFATYFGGSQADVAQDITIDEHANIYIAGVTNSADFPVTRGAFQTVCGGMAAGFCNTDSFITKLSSDGSKILYSTFLGGSSYDGVSGIAVDRAGSAYVAGQTGSTDFPLRNAFQSQLAGFSNAFVSKLNPAGNRLEFSTYLGGSDFDGANGIALGPDGEIYLAGSTTSKDFPLVKPFQPTNRGGYGDGFVSKISADGSALLRSSYFGGSGWDYPFRVAVDVFGSVSVIGFTGSSNLSVVNAVQGRFGGGITDAFALKLLPTSFAPLYATFLGGEGDEYGYGIYTEKFGQLWFGGSTSSVKFPIKKAFQSAYQGGPFDAFLTRLALTIPDYFRVLEDLLSGCSLPQRNGLLEQVVSARTHFANGRSGDAVLDLQKLDGALVRAGDEEKDATELVRAQAASSALQEALGQGR